MNQVIFKFPSRHDYTPENFLLSDSNKAAFDYINNFPWEVYAVNIYGEKSSGKTHLSHMVDEQIEVLEDVDESFNQEDLLHKLNEIKESDNYILLTSAKPISEINFELADLNSRLKAIPAIEIHKPDEQLVYMLLARQFAAKQLNISDEILNFLAVRLDRNFKTIFEAVEKIDNLSLQQKRNITIPLIKEIF